MVPEAGKAALYYSRIMGMMSLDFSHAALYGGAEAKTGSGSGCPISSGG